MLRVSWRRGVVVVAMVVSALAFARPAAATTITNLYTFSAGVTDMIGVHPFDPALGTLNSVTVGITGVMTVNGTTGLNMVQTAPGVFTPVPYLYQVDVTQDFFGLVGKYFDFNGDATFGFSATALGVGEAFTFQTFFTYGFTFNAASDLVGFVLPTVSSSSSSLTPPLGGVVGLRSGFLQTIVPIDEIDLIQTWSINGVSLTPSSISNVNSSGNIQIDYNYTPAPVPEPGSFVLLALGLCGAAVHRLSTRRRTM